MNKLKLTTLSASLALALGGASAAYAGAFQLFEQSAAGLGTAQATAGASANDASTEYTNPAGMVRLKKGQFSSGIEMINFHTQFTGITDTYIAGNSMHFQSGTANGGTTGNMVPNIHFVMPINDKLYYGAGLTVPFGLATSYKDDSVVAQYATDSNIQTKNFSQDLAYAITNEFSIGAGLDYQQFVGDFDTNELGQLKDFNQATSSAFGWHTGVLYQMSPTTRFGLSYHSSITQKAKGMGGISGTPQSSISTNYILPAWYTFGAHHDFTNNWSMMGTVNYTLWSKIKDLTLHGVTLILIPSTIVTPMNFRNTVEVSVGTTYQFTTKWTAKFGVGYDQTPTVNAHRELRLPDGDKTNVALGAHYQASKQVGFDFGYEHSFIKNAPINTNIALPEINGNPVYYKLKGSSKSSADIFGFQATYDF